MSMCERCQVMMRHVHAKNTEIAQLKELLCERAPPSAKCFESMRAENESLRASNARLQHELHEVRRQLEQATLDGPKRSPDRRAKTPSPPVSAYLAETDAPSHPVSQLPSAPHTPGRSTVKLQSSSSVTPRTRSPSSSAQRQGSIPPGAGSSTQRTPDIQGAGIELCAEYRSPAGDTRTTHYMRPTRGNPRTVAERVASLKPDRVLVHQPQREVARIVGWRCANLASAEKVSPQQLPPHKVARCIGHPVDLERSSRGGPSRSSRSCRDHDIDANTAAQLRELRGLVLKADRSAYLAMHTVEFSRDPAGPFKGSLVALKQIVATFANDPSNPHPVSDGEAWSASLEALSRVPAALAGPLASNLRQCVIAYDYMTDPAYRSGAGSSLTMREFVANLGLLTHLARQPYIAKHL